MKTFSTDHLFLELYIPMFLPPNLKYFVMYGKVLKIEEEEEQRLCSCISIFDIFSGLKPHSSFSTIAVFTFQSL